MASLDTTAISRRPAAETIPGYRLENLVGMGGMGEVHKAIQLSLGRIVAVKLLNPELAKDPAFVARFDKEAAALAALSHPNIVSIVDKGRSDTTYFLVMEFVEGPSLREQVRSPLLTPKEALRMMMEICRAVEYAHSRGVIHRDLKPENILFDQQAGGLAKVTDFGLASFLDDANSRFNLTSTHVSMGTLSYMAPEQRVDAKNADKRADIFSLGVILYELLTGEVPLGTFDPPSTAKPGIDSRLDAIIARCLKPDPDERYSTVAELIAELEPLAPTISSQPPKPLTAMQRVKSGLGRVARFTGRVVATLLVLAAMGVLGREWIQTRTKRAPMMAGTAFSSDLGPPSVKTFQGRMTKGTERRTLEVGEGPTSYSLVVSGRPLDIDGKALVFPVVVDSPSRAGQAVADVLEVEGDTALLKADVLADKPTPTPMESLRAFILGEPPDPKAALMLVGSPGRFVALVQEGSGAPMRLEWVLGERRGTMLGQDSPQGVTHLEIEVDSEGTLRGFVGTGKERLLIGEPLILGPEWKKQFGGDLPRLGVGCIEGTCRMEGLSYIARRAPGASPTAVAEASVSRPTPVSTKAPIKLAPPVKKPPTKAPPPPPKGGKKK